MIWEVGQDCRLEPVTHGAKTHVRTCPGDGDASSLLAAVRRAVATPDGGGGGGGGGGGADRGEAAPGAHDEL